MDKKLHILFLCSWFPSKVFKTNGDFIQRHAEAVALIHQVSVLHLVTDNTINKANIEIKNENNVQIFIGYLPKTSNPILKLSRFYKLYKELLKKITPFDIVHVNTLFPFGLFALHIKWTRKIPFIISEHWTGYLKPQNKEISFFKKVFMKIITRNADFVCPVSNNLMKSMVNFGLKGNYKPIPNVVDTDLFYPKNTDSHVFTILHASNMNDKHKNISTMLKVARELEDKIPNFIWNFIGGREDEFSQLLTQLKFKRKSINFIDHIPQKELAIYFQNATLFVLFSNYENLPCVILEAFGSGLPVISTNVGGIYEYFPNDYGFLIEKNNSDQLIKRIVDIYNNPINKKTEMQLYVKNNFSKNQIAHNFSNLYYRSLNK